LREKLKKVGTAVIMEQSDFLDWKNELSQSKSSKETRPLLAEVSVASTEEDLTYCGSKGVSLMANFLLLTFL